MKMADQQQFFLKWNDFQSNMVSSFRHLRDEKSFTDVTLACEGQTCKAHKMVLSACSPYFKSLLEVRPHCFLWCHIVKYVTLTRNCNISLLLFLGESVETPDNNFKRRSLQPLASNSRVHVRWRGECKSRTITSVSQNCR